MKTPHRLGIGAAMLALLLFAIVATEATGSARSITRFLGRALGFDSDIPAQTGGVVVLDEDESGIAEPTDLGALEPGIDDTNDVLVFPSARFAVNGVPMRDTRKAIINLVGPPEGSVLVRAYVYWQWACLETPIVGKHDRIRFSQAFPSKVGGGGFLVGTLVASSENPAWCDAPHKTRTYRVDVTPYMSSTGGGSYAITLPGGAAGSETHADPWAAVGCNRPLEALAEGAAIVAIYRSSCEPNGTVYVYDSAFTQSMFTTDPGLIYQLTHGPAPGSEARLAFVGGDGQVGSSYTVFDGPGLTETRVNGSLLAGPGSVYSDSDWNGSAGKPLPLLWDVAGHDVSSYVTPGSTATNIAFSQSSGITADNVVPVVTLLMVR